MTKNLKQSWLEINSWLEKEAPKIKQTLNPPATEGELDKLRTVVDTLLPSDLISLYSIHNGMDNEKTANLVYGIPFLSIQDSIREILNYNTLDPEELFYADIGIDKKYIFSKYRIPIGSDSGTCLLCVDLKPTDQGLVGQVILLDYERNTALVISKSVSEMYYLFSEHLKAGEYSLLEEALEDGVEWLKPSKEFDIINWHNTSQWGEILNKT